MQASFCFQNYQRLGTGEAVRAASASVVPAEPGSSTEKPDGRADPAGVPDAQDLGPLELSKGCRRLAAWTPSLLPLSQIGCTAAIPPGNLTLLAPPAQSEPVLHSRPSVSNEHFGRSPPK